MFEHIVVAVDGSPQSSKTVPFGVDLAQKYGSTVTVVHVREHARYEGSDVDFGPPITAEDAAEPADPPATEPVEPPDTEPATSPACGAYAPKPPALTQSPLSANAWYTLRPPFRSIAYARSQDSPTRRNGFVSPRTNPLLMPSMNAAAS